MCAFRACSDGALFYLKAPALEKTGALRHGFSSRLGGVSAGEFSALNLGFGLGDADEAVRENYRIFLKALEIDEEHLVLSKQVHENKVQRVTRTHCGNGYVRPNAFESADALITNVPGVALTVFYADCVPVLLFDPVKKAVGAVHAGWRGTAQKILKETILSMSREFESRPEELLVAIGPSIGPCCYEVGSEVFAAFEEAFPGQPAAFMQPMPGGKYMADLWRANRETALSCGVPPENIEAAGVCTMCEADRYFSHRASGGRRGSLAAIVELCL